MSFRKCSCCSKCGRLTLPEYDICVICLNSQFEFEENKNKQIIEVGDRVWLRRDGESKIYVGWVYSVKENVFRTSPRKYINPEESQPGTWWAFDNVDILEIEKREDE